MSKIIEIEIYDKREKTTETIVVEQLNENKYRAAENAVLNCELTFGTEFETRLNKNSKQEIIRITKDSHFSTRRFFLNGQFTESDYRVLGDEILRQGCFWQVDLGSIATVNLPQKTSIDLDEIFKVFNFHPTEIIDE